MKAVAEKSRGVSHCSQCAARSTHARSSDARAASAIRLHAHSRVPACRRSAIGRWMTCAASSARCRSHGRRRCSTMTPSTERRCSDGAFPRASPHSFSLRMRCVRALPRVRVRSGVFRFVGLRRENTHGCRSSLLSVGTAGTAGLRAPLGSCGATELTAMHARCELSTWRGGGMAWRGVRWHVLGMDDVEMLGRLKLNRLQAPVACLRAPCTSL